jgi:NADPH-dependent 2,4-dienoyl-CoA reductase/sulfur reductase-like enzyme
MRYDVAIIGAGPAGLSAAVRLAEHGRRSVVIDEQPRAGGQYFRQHSAAVTASVGENRPAGARLIARAVSAGVEFRLGTSVWGVDDDGRTLLLCTGDSIQRLVATNIVVATGAVERSLPFSGWQSPRVVTVGYAQHLAGEGVRLGDRVLVAGSGPFLLSVACSLADLGVAVAAVLEAGRPYRPSRASVRALAHPERVREFVGYRTRLARARIPVRSGRWVVRAEERPTGLRVIEAHTGDGGTSATHEVDAVCVGYGFRPQIDLLRLFGCATRTDDASGDDVVIVDGCGATSTPGIWAAGEVSGIGGVHVALAEGDLVAQAILGVPARLTAATRRTRAFAGVLDALYPSPRELAAQAVRVLPDDATICRCEAVTASTVRAATYVGQDLQAVKASTRAGMGPCQGRECAPGVAALCGNSAAAFAVRSPLRPVRLSAIADFATEAPQ